jgi:hypothetical protein
VSALLQLLQDIRSLPRLPTITISLMADGATDNHAFFCEMVRRFHRDATRRHPRFPLVRNFEYGVALQRLPEKPDDYLNTIEASARRNIKKAQRLGYACARIDFNQHRTEIAAIVRSSAVRQGPMPSDLMSGEFPAISDPASQSPLHDYPYIGASKDGELRAYAACMVAGELFAITDIYGHHQYQSDGMVPLLLAYLVRYARTLHPQTRYFVYDKYFGASTTLRRFKTKFGFLPHRVEWLLT